MLSVFLRPSRGATVCRWISCQASRPCTAAASRGRPSVAHLDPADDLAGEAALHAVRQGSEMISREDFEYARDRVLMGQRRESMALSDAEKELTAYHEAGHAVCATLLPDAAAGPVHLPRQHRDFALVSPADKDSLTKRAGE